MPRTYAFICGCGHSGTSLLANIFAAHPEVYVPLRETNVFLSRRRAWLLLQRLKLELLLSGRRHLIEKTPQHVRAVERIRRMVPGARFIFIVRDGRDVIASLVKRGRSVEASAERWIADNERVLAQRGAPDAIVMRYEDLVLLPERELERLCSFLGVIFSPDMLDYHRDKRLWFGQEALVRGDESVEHEAHRNWQINQPIFDGRGRWRTVLSEEELAPLYTGRGGELMRAFAYDVG